MTNNNQVNWDEIPEDVEAIIFNLSGDVVQHLKTIDGSLYFKVIGFMEHYMPSGQYDSLSDREENIGDFFGGATLLRRPPPITQPAPEPPESTQVETSEVEATTAPEFDWGSVDSDVEAVVLHGSDTLCYKVVDDIILSKTIESTKYKRSLWQHFDSIKDVWGDSFITRPPAITSTEPPESIQVETSEVEATTTPEFDWSSVDNDVEAVILYRGKLVQHLKMGLSGELLMNIFNGEGWIDCIYSTIEDRELFIKHYGDGTATLLRRPPSTTPSVESVSSEVEFYEGDLLEGMIPLDEETKPPSIYLILQEAQQSILKHHGVTGKVKFTVTCS